ncbi:hypothetical protein Fot_09724 [Forsythia ovata]|uniref:Uncharacterized protein n=1 Tax=Forsythia ovata TaxID=205694 RepID=A0ABD1WES3_9LAMI
MAKGSFDITVIVENNGSLQFGNFEAEFEAAAFAGHILRRSLSGSDALFPVSFHSIGRVGRVRSSGSEFDPSQWARVEIFDQEMDQSIQDCGSQTVTKTSQSRAKLQPRRCQKSASSKPNDPQFSEMRFMPTSSIIGPDVAAHGPDVAVHGPDLQPNVSFDNMVDDLQLMEHEEQSRMKAQRAKNIRNLRDSARFHAQRNRKPD